MDRHNLTQTDRDEIARVVGLAASDWSLGKGTYFSGPLCGLYLRIVGQLQTEFPSSPDES